MSLSFDPLQTLLQSKAFSVLEAVVGQLYLVVVAWFVGMHVSRKSGSPD